MYVIVCRVTTTDSSARDRQTRLIYEHARIGHAFRRGERPAILVVDFSAGFSQPHYPTGADLSAAVEATARLLAAARRQSLPILFTTIAYEPSLRDAGVWLQKMPGLSSLVSGSAEVELDPRLERRPDEPLIVKKGASAFFGTNVAALLSSERVDTVILCGATTSGCVRASAIDAVQHGFPTLLPVECVGDRARGPHDANLLDIQAKYADVIALDEVLRYLAELSAVSA
jgi:maleamate amidohydrolase